MTLDAIVSTLDGITERAPLIEFLGPLKLPHGLSEPERARLTAAVIAATARCWEIKVSGVAGKRARRAIAALKRRKFVARRKDSTGGAALA